MLLDFSTLFIKYRLKITGIIHCGAHHGEEVPVYHKHGIKRIALIEPCKPAFQILQMKYLPHHHIRLFNVACASYIGEAEMFVERANKGQSNSLLKPVEHLTHYPGIEFKEREKVRVVTMDSLNLTGYNFLNMDVQGAENRVLMGATKTLEGIDYIYTEVNADDANLYDGAARISELDAMLKDFERVETSFTGQGWGDALFIRRK